MWIAALGGCPWIAFDEHRENQEQLQQLLDGGGDADTDSDADSDADVDADTDADTDVPCVDDAYEPNDTLLTVTPLTAPTTANGVVCPENLSPVYGIPLDLFSVDVGATDVLDVSVAADGGACPVSVAVTDDQGAPFPDASAAGCGSVSVGWGASRYVVWLTGDPGVAAPYALDVSVRTCHDGDVDGYLSWTCGGPDCSDLEPGVYPGAPEVTLNGDDEDCDGGDDLESGGCPVVPSSAEVATGTLACADLQTGSGWDSWTVPNPASGTDGLSVVVQNGAGAADLVALLVAADGTTHYGLAPDRSELDDDQDCTVQAWTGETTACPGGCVYAGGGGAPLTVWVAQYPGSGCVDGAEYTLVVYSDGAPVQPTPGMDDAPLGF